MKRAAATKFEVKPERFYVEWHPTSEIEAECVKQGMRPRDGTSFWDWVEPSDHAKTRIFRNFEDAVTLAMVVAPLDCFGGARIYRQTQIVVKDGKRAFIRWDDQCFWDGINGDYPPDINKPDHWCEQ